ncbi:MAG: hypothetical protein MJZ37_07795 [Bacilli bacterium]|nr:hypothetical protein [Bacilli bacterium]
MENQISIFDFIESEEQKPVETCEGCIFYRDKCMYIKESNSDLCIECSKKLIAGDHIFSVDAGKIRNLMIIDAKGSSANYFKCADKKGQITEVNILSIRDWWNVTYEQAKKSKFFEEKPRKESNSEKPICKYSNHVCNKEKLWKIADKMDGISCAKECCRKCDVQYCGIRCNGSEDPDNNKKRIPEECINCEYIGKTYDEDGSEETDLYHCGLDGHPTWNEEGIPGKKCKKAAVEQKQDIKKTEEKPICKYSNHTCNKEVLHALAKESDPFCPSVCCRFCNTKYCGVRCNGSEEPKKKPEKAAEHVEQKQDIVPLPDFAKGKGWISVETIPKNMRWHIDVLGTYKYNNKECWSKCKGYYSAKDNKYVALDYPIDIPRAEWKFWRYRNSCINCTRYVKGTEQPPAGWGEVGWCNQHKQKVSSAEIGYCQKHERLDFYEY